MTLNYLREFRRLGENTEMNLKNLEAHVLNNSLQVVSNKNISANVVIINWLLCLWLSKQIICIFKLFTVEINSAQSLFVMQTVTAFC